MCFNQYFIWFVPLLPILGCEPDPDKACIKAGVNAICVENARIAQGDPRPHTVVLQIENIRKSNMAGIPLQFITKTLLNFDTFFCLRGQVQMWVIKSWFLFAHFCPNIVATTSEYEFPICSNRYWIWFMTLLPNCRCEPDLDEAC